MHSDILTTLKIPYKLSQLNKFIASNVTKLYQLINMTKHKIRVVQKINCLLFALNSNIYNYLNKTFHPVYLSFKTVSSSAATLAIANKT